MRKIIDLGWCMGRVEIIKERVPSLTLCDPADASDGTYIPSSSVKIFGKENIIVLRNAIDECLQVLEDKR